MEFVISSGSGAVLPALSTAAFTSFNVIFGKGRIEVATVGVSKGTSPISVGLTRRALVKIVLFSAVVVAGGFCKFVGSCRAADRKLQTDLCHFVSEKISLLVQALSIFFL